MVDEEDAIEMVDLVLKAGREQPFRLDFSDLVLVVDIAQPDLGRTLDIGVMLGQRQTAFVGGGQSLGAPDDLRVGDAQRLRLLAAGRSRRIAR